MAVPFPSPSRLLSRACSHVHIHTHSQSCLTQTLTLAHSPSGGLFTHTHTPSPLARAPVVASSLTHTCTHPQPQPQQWWCTGAVGNTHRAEGICARRGAPGAAAHGQILALLAVAAAFREMRWRHNLGEGTDHQVREAPGQRGHPHITQLPQPRPAQARAGPRGGGGASCFHTILLGSQGPWRLILGRWKGEQRKL